MSKENRGGTFHIDKNGVKTQTRVPTVMVASGKKVAKSIIKNDKKKSEKK